MALSYMELQEKKAKFRGRVVAKFAGFTISCIALAGGGLVRWRPIGLFAVLAFYSFGSVVIQYLDAILERLPEEK